MQIGVPTLDEWLGGALPGRIHLLTGGPGSGKTSACLHFVAAALRRGERGATVILDRPIDLQSHAVELGIDLRGPLREGRLTIVRYRERFGERLAAAASPHEVIADLARLLAIAPDTCVVIDPVSPFLLDQTGWSVTALAEWLDASGATSLLTWSGDPATADRRTDALLERAAVIVHFRREDSAGFQAEVIRARHPLRLRAPLSLAIRPRCGLVVRDDGARLPPIRGAAQG